MANSSPKRHVPNDTGAHANESVSFWMLERIEPWEFPSKLRDRLNVFVPYNEDDVCELCNRLMRKHATVYDGHSTILVCPGSFLMLRKDNSIEIVKPEIFKRRFQRTR